MGEKSELSQYPDDCTLEACCCTTLSPWSFFICLSMNLLQRPRDVGQAHWKHESPITCSLHYVSRLGALLIPAHWSASEPQERRHLCLRDAGEVPSTSRRLSLVFFQPLSYSLLISIFPAVSDPASLFNWCFSRSLPARHLSRRPRAPYYWACLITREGLSCKKKAFAPSAIPSPPQLSPASQPIRRAARPNDSSRPSRKPRLSWHITNEWLAEVGRILFPPLQLRLLV